MTPLHLLAQMVNLANRTELSCFYRAFTSYSEKFQSTANCTRASLLPPVLTASLLSLEQQTRDRPVLDKFETRAGSQVQRGGTSDSGTTPGDRKDVNMGREGSTREQLHQEIYGQFVSGCVFAVS